MPIDIHRSAYEGQSQLVAQALSDDPELINTKDADGRTALQNACSSGSASVVRVLLEQQATKVDLEAKDTLGWTALIIAASSGITEVVSELVHAGADVNATNDKGLTAMHYAASKGRIEIARILSRAGADLNVRDSASQLPLHRAASLGSVPLILLLTTPTATTLKPRLNLLDRAGNTPLHLAIESGHAEAACVLIEQGADRGRMDGEGKRAEEIDGVGGREGKRVRDFIVGRCGPYEE